MRTAPLVALIVAGTGSAALLHGQGSQSAAPTLTADQIFEYHTKGDQPGDATAGRAIDEKQCATCHRFGALGRKSVPI